MLPLENNGSALRAMEATKISSCVCFLKGNNNTEAALGVRDSSLQTPVYKRYFPLITKFRNESNRNEWNAEQLRFSPHKPISIILLKATGNTLTE